MATLTAIRDGIATRLATISGLEVHATVPGTVNPPAAIVRPDPGELVTYSTTMRDQTDDWNLIVVLLVQRGDEEAGQDNLDPYLDPSGTYSIRAAVDGDPTLAGVVHDCAVTGARNYGPFEVNGISYFGCEFALRVLA